MRTAGILLSAAAIAGMMLSAVPAEARKWKKGHHWRGHQGQVHHWHGQRHRGPGIALGVLGGALAGAAIASAASPYYYSYGYPYYYGYYYPY